MSVIGAGIDHIGIVGRDLSELESRYRALGFCLAPRCELVALAADQSAIPMNQHNSHLVFGSTYVELTAVAGDLKGHHLEHALGRYFGFHIFALLADNADEEHQRLDKLGLSIDPVATAGRSIEYPSGRGMGRFRWFRVPDEDAPEAFFCFVEHLTAELVFDPLLNDHPNGAYELHGMTICTEVPQSSAQRLARICGARAVETDHGFELKLRQGTIRIVGPERGQKEYGSTPIPALPFAVGFSVLVKDLSQTRAYLESAGLAYRDGEKSLIVEPDEIGQPTIGFVER